MTRHLSLVYNILLLYCCLVPSYVVEIEARDAGVPSLTGTATVTVRVNDQNDNTPIFTALPDVVDVSEDANLRALVYTVCQLAVNL